MLVSQVWQPLGMVSGRAREAWAAQGDERLGLLAAIVLVAFAEVGCVARASGSL